MTNVTFEEMIEDIKKETGKQEFTKEELDSLKIQYEALDRITDILEQIRKLNNWISEGNVLTHLDNTQANIAIGLCSVGQAFNVQLTDEADEEN